MPVFQTVRSIGNEQFGTYKPARIGYDEDVDSVAARTAQILDQDSAIQQNARTRADQAANARGLYNSTLAIEAGQKAAIDAAIPIATQDASNALSVRAANAQATNEAHRGLADAINQRAGQATLERMQRRTGLELEGARRQTGIALAGEERETALLLEDERFQHQRALQQELAQIEKDMENLRLKNQLTLTAEDMRNQVELQARAGEIERNLQELRGTQEMALQQMSNRNQMALQQLRGTQAQDLATLENDYRVLLQTSQNAAVLYAQVSTSMGEILAAPDISVSNKQTLINHQLSLLNAGLRVIGGTGNLDLVGLLDFQGNPTGGGTGAGPTVPGQPVPGFAPVTNPGQLTPEQLAALDRIRNNSGTIVPPFPGGTVAI